MSSNKSNIEVTRADEKKSIVIATVVQTSTERRPMDVGDYLAATQTAENVYYPNRSLLYDMYARIVADAAYTSAWERKRLPKVRNKKLQFKANDSIKEEFNDLIISAAFRDTLRLIMEEEPYGCSGWEAIPGHQYAIKEIPRKHIDLKERKITRYQTGGEGINYEGLSNIIVLGKNENLGWLWKIAPLVLYKQGNWGDWAQFVEKYGQPIQQFKYDMYSEGAREEAFKLAQEAGGNLSIAIPKQFDYDLKDGKQTNSEGGLQRAFKESLSDDITLIVLGNLETSSKGGGSLAKAQVQAEDQDDITADDMARILNVINSDQFLNILKTYGFATDGGRFQWQDVVDDEALIKRSQVDQFLINAGVPLDDDYYYQTYGRPKPRNYKQLKQEQEQQKKQPPVIMEDSAAKQVANNKKNKNIAVPPSPAERSGNDIGAWHRFRASLADFFDLAPKD